MTLQSCSEEVSEDDVLTVSITLQVSSGWDLHIAHTQVLLFREEHQTSKIHCSCEPEPADNAVASVRQCVPELPNFWKSDSLWFGFFSPRI